MRYEIQVTASEGEGSPMTLMDRATLNAQTVSDAAWQYAALFVTTGRVEDQATANGWPGH